MGRFLRIFGYAIVVLVASLAYFHMECIKEKNEREKVSRFDKFNPDITDCTVELAFATKGHFL